MKTEFSRGAAAAASTVSAASGASLGSLDGLVDDLGLGCCGFGHLGHLLDLVRSRLLSSVGMLRTGVDVQLALDLTAELVLGDHADDRLLDDPVGVLFQQLADRAAPQAAGVTRVTVGQLLVLLVAAEGDLFGVDDDDEVTAVGVGRECRLVLAAQQIGCRDGQATEHHVLGVDDVPRPRGVTRLGRVGGHSAYLSFSGLEPVVDPGDPGAGQTLAARDVLGDRR